MSRELVVLLIERGIMFAGGVYFVMLGTRKVGKRPGVDERYDAWHRKHGGTVTVLGWIIMACGGLLLVNDLLGGR